MNNVLTDAIFEKPVTFNGPIHGVDGQNGLTVLTQDGSFFGYYTNPTTVVTGMGDYSCNPVIAIGGSGLIDLEFNNCVAGVGSFNLADTSGLTSLTSLEFSNCGYFSFTLPDTSGLTSLETLSFSSCGMNNFSISDMSGLTSLTSLSFSRCGYTGFILPDTAQEVGLLSNLTSFTIDENCGTPQATQLNLIANAIYNANTTNGEFTVSKLVNDDTTDDLAVFIARLISLEDRGWTVNVAGVYPPPS